MPFLEEVAQEMQLRGIDVPPPAGGLAIGEYVDLGAATTVLYETGSAGPGIRVQDKPGLKYVDQGGQVIFRDATYELASERAKRAWREVFNGSVINRYLNGTYYLILEALTFPAFLQRDAQNRWVFFFNFRALKEPS